MLISHFLIFKNNYVLPNFNYGMLCYVIISTSSCYISMIRLMEKNKDDDDYDGGGGGDDNATDRNKHCNSCFIKTV